MKSKPDKLPLNIYEFDKDRIYSAALAYSDIHNAVSMISRSNGVKFLAFFNLP